MASGNGADGAAEYYDSPEKHSWHGIIRTEDVAWRACRGSFVLREVVCSITPGSDVSVIGLPMVVD